MYKTKEFRSLSELYDNIKDAKENLVFKERSSLSSKNGSYEFTGTHSYQEAIELLKYGWSPKAKELEKALKAKLKNTATSTKYRPKYDVVGSQASVPRYLQGIPTNMINRKPIKQKQKTINLVKSVCYSGAVSTDSIFEYSLAALQLVNAIEESGTRVNLFIVLGTSADDEYIQLKIKLKSANERLNVSKLAFPLVHPSMLRRILFRFIETSELVTKTGFIFGYGMPIKDSVIKRNLGKNEILIPKDIREADIEEFVKYNLK